MTDSELRAADADRERIAERLRQAAAEGRLTAEELEERLEVAFLLGPTPTSTRSWRTCRPSPGGPSRIRRGGSGHGRGCGLSCARIWPRPSCWWRSGR
jgi:hypothetical protein